MAEDDRVVLDPRELVLALAETGRWAIRVPGEHPSAEGLSSAILAGMTRAAKGNGKVTVPGMAGGVGVVPLHGVVTPHGPSFLDMLFGDSDGGGGLNQFVADVRAATADPEIRAIVLDLDSPGGLVDLVPEAAAELRALRDTGGKPIVAVANTQAASAAYWLASQAHEVVVTPSGEIGSIGVYALHRDMSGRFEQLGVKHTLISAGKYKVEGNPYEPLSDEAMGHEQTAVDDYYGMFVNDVAEGRKVSAAKVRSGYGEGLALTAERAVEANLADRVATLGETIGRLAAGKRVKRFAMDEEEPEPVEAEEPAASVAYSKEQRLRLLDAFAR